MVGVAFCGFLLKAPHGHPFWFSGNQGHSILPSYWPPAVISDIPQSMALPSTAFPPSYRTFTVYGFAVYRLSAFIPDLQSTALPSTAFPPSYWTFHSPRLCRPRPFRRHTGLTVHGLSAVIPDLQSTAFPLSYRTSLQSTALPSTAFLGILFLPLVLTKRLSVTIKSINK